MTDHPRFSKWLEKATRYCDECGLKDPEYAYAVIWLLREEYEAGVDDGGKPGNVSHVETGPFGPTRDP